jgi:hypothetical protein
MGFNSDQRRIKAGQCTAEKYGKGHGRDSGGLQYPF